MASLASAKPSSTIASLGTCSPADNWITSSKTISSGFIFSCWPFRITLIFSLVIRFSLSIILLARSSVIIPVKALNDMTAKNTILLQAWTKASARAITKFRALNSVNTLRLIISQVLELVLAVKSLVRPCWIFSDTWSDVKPVTFFIFSMSLSYHFLGKISNGICLQAKMKNIAVDRRLRYNGKVNA